RIVDAFADELVYVFVALVVAHVGDHMPVGRHHDAGVLVLEATQGGALDRLAARTVGIDLDDPAEAVGLVRIGHDVEARVDRVPQVAEAVLDQAVAVLHVGRNVGGVVPPEVAVEVLFAGQVGAPGCFAVGAVVERAEHFDAGRVGGRAQRGRPGGRTLDCDRGVAGDATVVDRVPDVAPGAVGGTPHFDDRCAVGGQGLLRLVGGKGQQPVVRVGVRCVEVLRIDVLVIH